jgi:HD-like signal output (HDOD) protein
MVAKAARILDLRPFPGSVHRLLALADDPDSSVAELRLVIEADPSIAVRILRIVNSAAFALRTRCTSLDQAVVLLGRRALTEPGVALALLDVAPGGGAIALWLRQHSSAVAGLARHLTMVLGAPANDLFTIGLLHDLGKVLELQMGDDDYPMILEDARGHRDMVHVLEQEGRGHDHAVLKAWQIPDPVPQVVALHHQPGRALDAGGPLAMQTMLIRLADHLSYLLEETAADDSDIIAEIAETEALVYLLAPERLTESWDHLCQVALESQSLMAH